MFISNIKLVLTIIDKLSDVQVLGKEILWFTPDY